MEYRIVEPPAHKIFIDQYLDWEKVQERLVQYKHIAHHYSIEFLENCSSKPPYYCHYLAWRLGTWRSENLFEFLDNLLSNGALLNHWVNNKNLLRSCNFDDFWGLIWQLQIAKFFCNKKEVNVEWMPSGPDLQVSMGDKDLFVECYTYRKSFAVKAFIEELFHHIDQRIMIRHTPCTLFSLPKDNDIEAFLHKLFKPYLDPEFLKGKLKEAQVEHPILLPIPNFADNLSIYVEGNDQRNYTPGNLPMGAGDPEKYLTHAIKEALNNKRYSNQLRSHHPNLFAVNYLLDQDFQMAMNRQKDLGLKMPSPDFGCTFDMVLLCTCGIDEIPSKNNFYLMARPGSSHFAQNFWLPLIDQK